MLYSLIALIWVIVAIYVIPCRKEIDRLYALDEIDYEMDVQSAKMNFMIENRCSVKQTPIQPFNDYLSETVEDQNKLILIYVRNGIIGSIVYFIIITGVMVDCNKFM